MPVRTLAPKGVDLVGVSHRLEKGTSASEVAGPRREVDCDVPRWLGRRTKHPWGVETFTSMRILKL